MSQIDHLLQKRPIVYKSPSWRKQTSKLAAFFPIQNTANKEASQGSDVIKQTSSSRRPKLQTNPQSEHDTTVIHMEQNVIPTRPVLLPKVLNQSRESSQEKCLKVHLTGVDSTSSRRTFFSPDNEFFLGKQKPVKVVHNNGGLDSSQTKSIIQSSRFEKKVTNLIQAEEFFSNVPPQKQTARENYFTTKLRKSYTTFHQSKEQIKLFAGEQPNVEQNKIRQSHQFQSQHSVSKIESRSGDKCKKTQSEDRIKIVDLFQYKKPQREREEQRLKTIVKCENQTGATHSEPTDRKIKLENFNEFKNFKEEPFFARQIKIKREDSLHERDNSSQLIQQRQRIFSTKTPLKSSIIKTNFGSIGGQSKLNESKDLLLKLKQRIPFKSTHNNSNSIQTSNFQNSILESNQIRLNSVKQNEPCPQYFTDKLTPHTEKKGKPPFRQNREQKNDNHYQIEIPDQESGYDKLFSEQKNQMQTDRILDLLLLSTGELKTYFNGKDSQDSLRKNTGKKVKFIQNQQCFPRDFFNILDQ